MANNDSETVSNKATVMILLFVVGLSLAYAVVRYNVVRHVPLNNLPLYISNKALALAATLLIGLSFVLGPLARFFPKLIPHLYLRKRLGVSGFWVAAIHAVISLAILTPAYYPRLFEKSGKMTWQGETFLLFGILAFLVFGAISLASLPPVEEKMEAKQWKSVQRLGYLAYGFVLLHVGLLGYRGWSSANNYKYGMASITLIAAIFIVFVLLMRVLVAVFPKKSR